MEVLASSGQALAVPCSIIIELGFFFLNENLSIYLETGSNLWDWRNDSFPDPSSVVVLSSFLPLCNILLYYVVIFPLKALSNSPHVKRKKEKREVMKNLKIIYCAFKAWRSSNFIVEILTSLFWGGRECYSSLPEKVTDQTVRFGSSSILSWTLWSVSAHYRAAVGMQKGADARSKVFLVFWVEAVGQWRVRPIVRVVYLQHKVTEVRR